MKNIDDYIDSEGSKEETSKNGDKLEVTRDSKGRILPGSKLNPNGRPPAGETIVEKFRNNDKGLDVINNIIKIASTLGQDGQHRDALACAKLVVERLVPTLKSSDLNLSTGDETGFVVLPEQKKAKRDDSDAK